MGLCLLLVVAMCIVRGLMKCRVRRRFIEVLDNLVKYEMRGSGAVLGGNVLEIFSVMRILFLQIRSRFWRVCLGLC